jgi:pimeloyl-ACP methyl ester carboxylesterase
VRTLVLTEPPAITLFVSNVPKPLEIFRLLLSRPRAALAVLKFGAMGLGPATAAVRRGDLEAGMRLFGAAVLGRTFYQRLSETRREQVRVNSIRAEFLGSGFPPLDAIRVGRVQTPALLINGGQSPALFRCLVDRLEELLPHNERVQIDRASHIVHEDDPAAYNRAVLSFLAKHGSTETPNA